MDKREFLTEAEQKYRGWEILESYHASNYDWDAVLRDKWGLLKNQGGN